MTVQPTAATKLAATKTNFAGIRILPRNVDRCNASYGLGIVPFLDPQAQTLYSLSTNSMNVAQQHVKTKRGETKGILGIKKPKRPLTCYNFFFRHERARLLGYSMPLSNPSDTARRRLHRKTHGRIGFLELSKSIGDAWNQLSKTDRAFFEAQAAADLIRYKREMEIYKEKIQPGIGIGEEEKSRQATHYKHEFHEATPMQAGAHGNVKLDTVGEVISSIDMGITSKAPSSELEKRVKEIHSSGNIIDKRRGICEGDEPTLSGGSMKDLEDDLRRILSDEIIDALANL